jgi:hypothetical protein
VGLQADLQGFRAGVGFVERHEDIRAKPRVGPKLQTTFQPWHLGVVWRRRLTDQELLEEAGWFKSIRAGGPCAEGPEAPEHLGLSMARNSDRPPRYGFEGLTAPGRTNVSEALALLEAKRSLLSFWSITAPTDALRHIARHDCWPPFVEAVVRRLRRLLQKRLGQCLAVGVAELQPRRTRTLGIPCPHLHLVFVGRLHVRARWAISPAELDAIIRDALAEVGFTVNDDCRSAGNVQRVKRSVRAYLAKYMTKGSSDAEVWKDGPWQGLIPRQWWLWSAECRAMVEACRTELPTGFLAWVWRNAPALLQEGLIYIKRCKVPAEAFKTYRIYWHSVARLALIYARWLEWKEDRLTTARRELGIWTVCGELVYARPITQTRVFVPLVFEPCPLSEVLAVPSPLTS